MYKKPSMHLGFPVCDFKCDREYGSPICQNSKLARSNNILISVNDVIKRYIDNPITRAVVIGGLEPFDSLCMLVKFIEKFRENSNDDIVIYTGYYHHEIDSIIDTLIELGFKNIIIKFGRYIPNDKPIFSDVLGVELASSNQYAKMIS